MKHHKCTLTSYICFLILPCTVLGTLIEFATKKSLFNFNANMSKLMVWVFLDDLDIRKKTGPCSLSYKTAIWPKMDKFRTKFNRTKNLSKRTLKLSQQFPAINVNTRSVQSEMTKNRREKHLKLHQSWSTKNLLRKTADIKKWQNWPFC